MRDLCAGPFPRSLMLAFRASAAPLEPPQMLLQASRPAAHAPLLSLRAITHHARVEARGHA